MSDSANPPEVVLKQRRTAFENSKFFVYADHIADADGREVPDYLVVAPRVQAGEMITGVTVLPVYENRIVLIKTFRHAVRSVVLETARGFVDPKETPEQAALRELTEETGLLCKPDRLIPLGFSFPEASTLQARVALFVAMDCAPGPRTDHSEIGLGQCVSFSMEEAEGLLREMSLEDVTTALCLHRFFMTGTERGLRG